MATIFLRGFLRRSLPALLALVLGFLVAPQPASSAPPSASPAAAAVDVTARTPAAEAVHSGHSSPAATTPAGSAAPIERHATAGEPVPAAARTLRTQVTARTLGSRAPPSTLA